MSSNQVINFGCRLNLAESQRIEAALGKSNLSNTIVFNGCSVTHEAERKLQQAIRRSRRQHPQAQLILTGCPASTNPDKYQAMPELDQVIDNLDKLRWAATIAPAATANNTKSGQQNQNSAKTRLFLPVQNGCNHACTFCIIPKGRGASRSRPYLEIKRELQQLAASGLQEVVITGVDITAYGDDLQQQTTLARLLRQLITDFPLIPRWRLSSIDSAEIDAELFQLLVGEDKIMPYLHFSLQSGSDLILKRMRRRHLSQDYRQLLPQLRQQRPEIVFGADLICGFPTESEQHFAATCKLVQEIDISLLHVFPFSARAGTPAARMPQLPITLRKQRARQLRTLGRNQLDKLANRLLGSRVQVLRESADRGFSQHYLPCRLLGSNLPAEKLAAEKLDNNPGNLITGVIRQWDTARQQLLVQPA